MSKTRNTITWVLTALLALAYLTAGYLMVSGQAAIVQEFTDFGLPSWIRVTIGVLEITGAVLLLIPAFTGMAAFGLSIIMVGGTACHLMFTSPPQAIPPILFFSILTYIYLTRKNVVPVCLQKQLIG
ncbi:MAG: DoxX family protein [Gammaproteobacteria bacterium]|nr:DoxX family protein [Gammaproteobacteria bacterium]